MKVDGHHQDVWHNGIQCIYQRGKSENSSAILTPKLSPKLIMGLWTFNTYKYKTAHFSHMTATLQSIFL